MRLIVDSRIENNARSTLHNLVALLGVQVTKSALLEVVKHPDYPALAAISDSLSDWNIQNVAVEIQPEQIRDVTTPAVFHMRGDQDYFVVVTDTGGDVIKYVDPSIGYSEQPADEFMRNCTGVVLLAEADESSGEENYSSRRFAEVRNEFIVSFASIISCVCFVMPLFVLPFPAVVVYLIKVIGLGLALLLTLRQLGVDSGLINYICSAKVNACHSLARNGAGMMNLISLPEIVAFYYGGSLFTLLILNFAGREAMTFLYILSIAAAFVTLFTIYRQLVTGYWCMFCLLITFAVWAELAVYLLFRVSLTYDFSNLLYASAAFVMPLATWIWVRRLFRPLLGNKRNERRLDSFARNTGIFNYLLSQLPAIEEQVFEDELATGNPAAAVRLIFVGNPVCLPCAKAHRTILNLRERLGNALHVTYRFNTDVTAIGGPSYRLLVHLFKLRLSLGSEKTLRALDTWYSDGNKLSVDSWIRSYPISSEPNESRLTKALSTHKNWIAGTRITETPTLFINGRKFPSEYSIEDLEFHVRSLIDA